MRQLNEQIQANANLMTQIAQHQNQIVGGSPAPYSSSDSSYSSNEHPKRRRRIKTRQTGETEQLTTSRHAPTNRTNLNPTTGTGSSTTLGESGSAWSREIRHWGSCRSWTTTSSGRPWSRFAGSTPRRSSIEEAPIGAVTWDRYQCGVFHLDSGLISHGQTIDEGKSRFF